MALIRDAIRIDNWARAQHRDHTGDVRPEWCPLCRERQSRMVSDRCATCGHPSATHDYGSVASAEPCYQPGCSCQAFIRTPPEPEPPSPAAPVARPATADGAMAVVRQLAEVGRPPHPDIRPIVKAARAIVAEQSTPTPRPRYRLTQGGIVPCSPDAPAPRSLESATVAAGSSLASCDRPSDTASPPAGVVVSAITTGATVTRRRRIAGTIDTASPARSPARPAPRSARKSRGAGAYAGLLDRLEAIGATFCPECCAYLWPEHTHLTRGPIVPLGIVTLAEPVMVDGIDGQSELVTIQEREAA